MLLKYFKDFLWLTPLLAFLLGYQLLNWFQPDVQLSTPNLVGCSLYAALKNLSAQNLNLRVIAEKLDPNLPDQVIISQQPYAGQAIKPNQTIFVVVARQPDPSLAPDLIGKTGAEITALAQREGLKLLSYYQPSQYYPAEQCFAQQPLPNQPLTKRQLTVYLSAGPNQPVLVPNLVNLDLAQVQEFCQTSRVKLTVINLAPDTQLASTNSYSTSNSNQSNQRYIVTAQWPLAGTIVNLSQLSQLQVQVTPV